MAYKYSKGTFALDTIKAKTALVPDAEGGADLGTAALEWGDMWIADDKKITFGSDAAGGNGVTMNYDTDESNNALFIEGGDMKLASQKSFYFGGADDTGQYIKENGSGELQIRGDSGVRFETGGSDVVAANTFDANGGFKIGGTTVSATAAELNYLDIATLGTSQASKAVTVDANGDLLVPDSDKYKFGAGSDMELYHDGTNSYIANKTGALKVATETSGIAVTIGHTTSEVTVADNLTVAGDLTVTGNTITNQVEVISTSTGVLFEGGVDDGHEATLKSAVAGADVTYTLPNLTGHVPLLAGAVSNANVTAAEFALLDGSGTNPGSTAVAGGDGILTNDNGTMRQTTVDTFDTYLAATTKTLTNKTLTAPTINGVIGGTTTSQTITALTTAGITATANIDIGAYDLRAATVTADGLTSGRVVFASTAGVLSDDGDMTFSGDTLTVTKLGAFEAAGSIDFSDEAMTNVNVDSGAIDGAVIGANTAAAGTFAALVAKGNVDLGDATSDTITATGRFDSDLVPSSDSARDLGTSALQWAELHLDVGYVDQFGGPINFNSEALTNVNVDSGAIDGVVIGAASAAAGTFAALVGTSLSVSDGNITNVGSIALDSVTADDGSSFSFGSNWTAASRTCANLGTVTTADINGGSMDGVTIGAASAAPATVTALAAAFSGSVSQAAYNAKTTDFFIGCDTVGNSVVVSLPAASAVEVGRMFVVKDITGYSTGSNLVKVTGSAAADTIEGTNATVSIDSAYGAVNFISDGTSKWYIW